MGFFVGLHSHVIPTLSVRKFVLQCRKDSQLKYAPYLMQILGASISEENLFSSLIGYVFETDIYFKKQFSSGQSEISFDITRVKYVFFPKIISMAANFLVCPLHTMQHFQYSEATVPHYKFYWCFMFSPKKCGIGEQRVHFYFFVSIDLLLLLLAADRKLFICQLKNATLPYAKTIPSVAFPYFSDIPIQ